MRGERTGDEGFTGGFSCRSFCIGQNEGGEITEAKKFFERFVLVDFSALLWNGEDEGWKGFRLFLLLFFRIFLALFI